MKVGRLQIKTCLIEKINGFIFDILKLRWVINEQEHICLNECETQCRDIHGDKYTRF